jgi:alginate O-acetyltransferase complex protein AlgI
LWVAEWRLRSVRARQIVWLLSSYAFYFIWASWFAGILLFSSLMNYALGAFLRRKPATWRLWMGIGLNLLLLGSFKYWPSIANLLHPSKIKSASLLLPLGISFWTFQALSYLIDIYRGEDVEPNLVELMLYLSFWPTVISGPICRASNMVRQFRSVTDPTWPDLASGMPRICVGLLMIGVSTLLGTGIVGQGVNEGFARNHWTALDVWLLAIGYGFQLFFDFAGYSHIVIGAARLFRIELQENFDRPFLAATPSSFWTRWHMSLSFWIRDYVFMSMAGQRGDLWWRKLSLWISMVLFGLWHGATVLYLIWGAYHGTLLILHREFQGVRRRIDLPGVVDWVLGPLSWCATFGTICLGWILFRAHDLHQAATMYAAVISVKEYSAITLSPAYSWLVLLTVGGYFATVGLAQLLERAENAASLPRLVRLGLSLLSRERWVWGTPIVAVLAIYAYFLVGRSGVTGSPLLYRVF